jgi:hypothetical protein
MRRGLLIVTLMLATAAVSSAQTFYFPQVAIGGYNGGFWTTAIFLSNATGATASGTVVLTRSDGGQFRSTWIDEAGNRVGSGNMIPFQLGPRESRKFRAAADIPLTTGFATITSNSAGVLGTAVFTQLDGLGNMSAEAGVPMGIPLGKQAVFVDTINGFSTGVAIANPNTASLHINFELVSDTGQIIGTSTRDLAPGQHMAVFTSELFPNAGPMVGRLQFYCVNPMVAVALRFEPSLTVFTTMPPIAIAP